MKTHKFARKPFYVDAVRVSEQNIEEVAGWCDGTVEADEDGQKFIRVKVHRPLTERQTQAFVGDWVLYAGSGYKVYVPKAFDKSFEKVKTLTKAQADAAGIKVPHEKSQKPREVAGNRGVTPRTIATNLGAEIRAAQAKVREVALVGENALATGEVKIVDNGVVYEGEKKVPAAGSVAEAIQAEVPKFELDPIEPLDSKVGGLIAQADAVFEAPKSMADIEADKLIAEVEQLRES